jgi:hypothetical protein
MIMKYMQLCLLALVVVFASSSASAEADKSGGYKFHQSAKEYDKLAIQAKRGGDLPSAEDYTRLAKIKRSAAKLADEGRWTGISWVEYEKILERVNKRK